MVIFRRIKCRVSHAIVYACWRERIRHSSHQGPVPFLQDDWVFAIFHLSKEEATVFVIEKHDHQITI